ncbi:hypothetical protein [Sphingomonas lacusdianchii]|uniref:hypothetical protein n=1 Tax=Sphingomonas lacusdianchii TaxID=2917992 RepID=UPI001F55FF7E|nr:hypothetical protein [Sphingomonas sp. JXJ CY 53]
MTEMLDHIREAVKVLPGVEERQEDGATVFLVEGEAFVRVDGAATVRGDDGWVALPDSDAAAIDDAVAHAWELAAPRGLLEAGGR